MHKNQALCASLVLGLGLALPASAWQLPSGVTCTPNDEFCAAFAPTDRPIHEVAKALKSAKKSIRIATYNMDALELGDIIKEKLNEGLSVEYMVDFKLSKDSNIVWRSLEENRGLKRLRIPVMRGRNPQMHNKVIIIDDERVLFGSANFTYSGLVANYENVLSSKNPIMVKKFSEELNELKNTAESACKLFAKDASKCGTSKEEWDRSYFQLVTTGKIPAEILKEGAECSADSFRYGLLDPRNKLNKGLRECLKDERYAQLADSLHAAERFSDGTLAKDFAGFRQKYNALSGEKVKVLFSPEDPVGQAMVQELELTLKNPSESFAFISSNFLTDKPVAAALLKMKKAGVHMRIFFDQNRLDDDKFSFAKEEIAEIGVAAPGGVSGIDNDHPISGFVNSLTGPYGCNHNKMAVIYSPEGGLRLMNGSANWSKSAIDSNDENLTVVQDDALASIYLREILSQLFVYRYNQQRNNAGFSDDIAKVTAKAPCVATLLGRTKSCSVDGGTWAPEAYSSIVLSVQGIPANAANESVWVRLANAEVKNSDGSVQRGVSLPLFTHEVFAGRWVVGVSLPVAHTLEFKFYKSARRYFEKLLNLGLPNESWEYGGIGNDRKAVAPQDAVHSIQGIYTWGSP
jgi:phosphatidylserine/phosphatidylglycerophosphate/cardiolipin synthase-like enzyme